MKAKISDSDSDVARASASNAMPAPVSAPTATGGAGTTFEQHVGAYWLAQLLVNAIPPILVDATVAEVSFQTERLGWHTDDFLIVCTAGGTARKLAGQVKRSFTLSASDEECAKVIADFWKDFNDVHLSKEHDRLALVMLRGTNTLLEHFVGLLDCARSSRHGPEVRAAARHRGFYLQNGGALLQCAGKNYWPSRR